jgi:transposase
MYLKKVTVKNAIYLKLVETVWDKEAKKRKQKTILNIGRLDDLMQNGLPFIVKSLAQLVNKELAKNNEKDIKQYPNLKDINTISDTKKYCYGHIVYRNLWNIFEIGKMLKSLIIKSKIEFNFVESVYLMIVNQLLTPSSKLRLSKNNHNFFKTEQTIDLQHYYRSLDILAKNKTKIEEYFFNKNRDLFNNQIDIVFYDVTTFYFESQKSDNLKDFGFDKDNKINNVHIVMGLLIDKTGKPIGYELFKGNTYEGHTLIKTIKKLKERFNIQTVVIVADKGLNSKINLKEIKDAGFHYIISGRLKSMKKSVQEIIFNQENYKSLSKNDLAILNKYDNDQTFKYKVIDYKNEVKYKENQEDKNYKKILLDEKLICTYSSKRAYKDKKDRERMLEKANLIIEKNDKTKLTAQHGHKKYIDKIYRNDVDNQDFKLVLNEAKIKEEEKFDGYYVIESSNPQLTANQVIENYHYLYKIEESFRIMKTTMRLSPINHWTENRIEGHFVMCFMAFLLERELELRLLKNDKIKAPEQIKESINSLIFTEFTVENEKFYLRNEHQKLASEILAILKIKQPENVQSLIQIENYMKPYI